MDKPRTRERRYELDESYFDRIDTPDKAYWLGFIAGDGCVRDRGVLSVGLSAKDRAHLEALGAALSTTTPIREYTAQGKARTHTRPSYQYVVLSLTSSRLVGGLASHGVTPRKSLTLQVWRGPADLMPHYWRGLIDADGTIMATRNQWQISLVGSKSVVHAFADWVRQIVPTPAKTKQIGNIWIFKVRGRVQCRTVAEALYGDSLTALSRKAIRAAELIAAGPPKRIGHPTSPETRLLLSRVAGRPPGKMRTLASGWRQGSLF